MQPDPEPIIEEEEETPEVATQPDPEPTPDPQPESEPEVVVQPDPEPTPDPQPIIEEEEEEEIVVQPVPDPDPEPIILEEEEKPVAAAREEITIIEEPEPAEEIEEPVTLAATSGRQYPPLPREIEECGDASTYTEENCARDLDVISVLHGLNFTLKNNWLTDSAENLKGLDRLTEVDIISQNDAFNPDHANYEFQYRNDIPLTEKIEVTYHKEDAFSALFSYKGSNIQILEDVTLKATFPDPQLKYIGIEGYIGGDDGITMGSTNFGQIRFSVIDVSDENGLFDGQFTDITQVRFSNIHINPGENNVVKGSFKNDGTTSTFPTQVVGELTMKGFYDASTRLDPTRLDVDGTRLEGTNGFEKYEKNRDSRGDNALAGVFLVDKTSEKTERLVPYTPEELAKLAREKANAAYNAIKLQSDEITSPKVVYNLTWQRIRQGNTNDTVTINSKRIPLSRSIETRHGWKGGKYELTDGGKTYEAYFYVDSPTPLYSFYGYWMIKDSTGNLEDARGFAGFGGSNRNLPNLGNLTSGTATYTGDAVGQFALKGSNPDSGQFTATATLTADFGTDKIKGTIDNFSGPTNGSSWSIELKETSFENSQGTLDAGKTVLTIDGVEGDSGGLWDAEMFKTDSGFPRDIVGGFYSEHSGANAVIVGGFGAEKE